MSNKRLLALMQAGPILLSTITVGVPVVTLAEDGTSARAGRPPLLDEIIVLGRTRGQPAFSLERSETVRTRTDIDTAQPPDLFTLLGDVPGLSVDGGPLLSGKKFNIRGFGDTEDISVELDGVPRDFEKYRFGAGVFIDPDLLDSVEVIRTPSVRNTPGAIGGAIRARSRDPRDFLEPDAAFGGQGLLGYASNNAENRYSAVAAAVPVTPLAILVAGSWRDSDDIRLPDGARLPNTAGDSRSLLARAQMRINPAVDAGLTWINWKDASLQPFDATAGQPGLFGNVRREIDDDTFALSLGINPASSLVAVTASLGATRTRVIDVSSPGQSLFANPVTGLVRDEYDFRGTSFRIENTGQIPLRYGRIQLDSGIDGLESRRDVSRITESQAINASLYPGGFNPAQPPGRKRLAGGYMLLAVEQGPLTLRAGGRRTAVQVQALGGTRTLLETLGESSSIRLREDTTEYGADWALMPAVTLFYNRAEAFRPPLIDEYFTQGPFSRCIPAFLGYLAPASRVCGALYLPELAATQEAGVGLQRDGSDGDIRVRIAWFESTVRQTLESITVVDGQVSQPGVQRRKGVEVEAAGRWRIARLRLAWSTARGRQMLAQDQVRPLFTLPGDRLSVSAGTALLGDRIDLELRYQRTASRTVVVGQLPPGLPVAGRQAGYTLYGLSAAVRLGERTTLRIVGENLGNASYQLNNGFGGGIGTEAPGRDLRAVLVSRF